MFKLILSLYAFISKRTGKTKDIKYPVDLQLIHSRLKTLFKLNYKIHQENNKKFNN